MREREGREKKNSRKEDMMIEKRYIELARTEEEKIKKSQTLLLLFEPKDVPTTQHHT